MSSPEPTLMFLYECQVPGIQYTVAVHEQLSDIVASGLLLGSIRHQVCPPSRPPGFAVRASVGSL